MRKYHRLSQLRKFITKALPFIIPLAAEAQLPGEGGGTSSPIFKNLQDVFNKFLCPVFGWLFTGAMVLGVIFAVIAAIQYITAGGNPEKATKAHKTLLYAVIGLAVALLARGVPAIVASLFSQSLSGGC